MNLWEWSARTWTAAGVEIAALDLQDAQGQNIPLLLWAAWCARTGRRPDDDTLDAACDTARAWEDRVAAPLRAIRRGIKSRTPDMDDEAREATRNELKAVELASERRLLEALEALSPGPAGGSIDPLPALVAVSRRWSEVTPRTALKLLADHLPA